MLKAVNWTLDNMPITPDGIKRRLTDPRCPAEILREYARLGWEEFVVANPSCPRDVIEEVVEKLCHPGQRITAELIRAVQQLLGNPKTPPELLERIAEHRDFRVKWAIRFTRPELLRGQEYEALSPYEYRHADIPPDKIVELFNKTKSTIGKTGLLRNKSCPRELAQRVVEKSSNPELLAAAIESRTGFNPDLLLKAYQRARKRKAIRDFVAVLVDHPDCPDEVLLDIAMQKSLFSQAALQELERRKVREAGKQ